MQNAGADSRHDGDDRDDSGCALRRQVHPRHRPSGPQVIEGWHGVAYGKPLMRTREYIDIVRKVLARQAPMEHKGEHYQISVQRPGRQRIRQTAEEHPAWPRRHENLHSIDQSEGIALSAEVADGLIPVWMNPERFDLYKPQLDAGFAKAGGGKSYDISTSRRSCNA